MEDYKKLVNRLREEPKDSRKAVLSIYDLCIDAAYAIEILLDKLKYAEGERDVVTKRIIELESNDGQVRKALHDKGFDNLDMLFEDYSQVKNELASYKNTGLEPQDIISAVDMAKIACALHELNAYKDLGPIDHIRDLIKAEQDGRLVVLPCKVGDDVWFVRKFGKERCITKREVDCVNIDSRGNVFVSARRISGGYIGKTVFLTRQEAEAAIAQEGGTNEDSGGL